MPVFLTPETLDSWLDCERWSFRDCEKQIDQSISEIKNQIEAFPVSDLVNSIKNDCEDCILPRQAYSQK